MKITKIEKVNGKKKGIYTYPFNGKIGLVDRIWFICEYCGKENYREKRVLDEKYPYCEKCLREIKNKEKYGVKNVFQLENIKKKIKETNLKKYNKTTYTQTDEYKIKSKNTCLEKFGKQSYTQTDEYKKRVKETSLKKYGVDSPLKDKSVREKIKGTCLEKYGVDNSGKVEELKVRKKNSYEERKNFENVEINVDYEKYNGIKGIYEWKCKVCGNIFEYNSEHNIPICRKCHPSFRSKIEEEISLTLDKTKIETCNRNIIPPYELDIYIPDKNLAIEFNGLYWHSEQVLGYKKKVSPRQYHLNKTKLCQEKGIKLLQFFEDEWIEKKEIIKSIINNSIGINKERIFARKTKIIEISFDEKNNFLKENHLQGSDGSNICLGLLYNNESVSVIGFNKSKNSIENQFELSRFASKINTKVIGGASKLLNYFIKKYKPKSIYSFSDLRISSGNLYEKLGFKLVGKNPPAYWYIKKEKRIHRFNFRKSELKKKFPEIYSDEKTEWQMMQEAGYDRIWDCGNDKWEMIIS